MQAPKSRRKLHWEVTLKTGAEVMERAAPSLGREEPLKTSEAARGDRKLPWPWGSGDAWLNESSPSKRRVRTAESLEKEVSNSFAARVIVQSILQKVATAEIEGEASACASTCASPRPSSSDFAIRSPEYQNLLAKLAESEATRTLLEEELVIARKEMDEGQKLEVQTSRSNSEDEATTISSETLAEASTTATAEVTTAAVVAAATTTTTTTATEVTAATAAETATTATREVAAATATTATATAAATVTTEVTTEVTTAATVATTAQPMSHNAISASNPETILAAVFSAVSSNNNSSKNDNNNDDDSNSSGPFVEGPEVFDMSDENDFEVEVDGFYGLDEVQQYYSVDLKGTSYLFNCSKDSKQQARGSDGKIKSRSKKWLRFPSKLKNSSGVQLVARVLKGKSSKAAATS
eukprot:TRINITY_DN10468_c0_g2_i2.p1 TRINITY_DN10468_c0_g2~~TRINITY_DN10468_c0_g2_i2.p1  ORF type:complete len:411 (+),score=122.27 TRINITY_DN10468_c0_g2_i2:629-1861(+)